MSRADGKVRIFEVNPHGGTGMQENAYQTVSLLTHLLTCSRF
jgi:hypothetical protein